LGLIIAILLTKIFVGVHLIDGVINMRI